jgi:hypothetical protein
LPFTWRCIRALQAPAPAAPVSMARALLLAIGIDLGARDAKRKRHNDV